MAGNIFISYRHTDQAMARRLHTLLKERGVEAWYDEAIGTGEDWRGAIAAALEAAPYFVLLFSKAAAESEQIAKELAAATYSKKTIIPVRLADVSPAGAFLYELAARNWFDLFPDGDARMVKLADYLAALVRHGPDAMDAAQALRASLPPPTRPSMGSVLRRPWALGAIAALLLALIGGAAVALWPHPPATPRLAVMRFETLDTTEPYFAEGVADELISELSQVKGLDVTARASSFALSGGKATPAIASKELGATLVLTGSVRHVSGGLRVDAQLVQAPDGKVVWSQTFDRAEGDVLSLQRDIAVRVAQAADVRVSAPPPRQVDPAAYRLYLQARELGLSRTNDDWQPVRDLYRQAVDLDPIFAKAWAALASAEANLIEQKFDRSGGVYSDAMFAPVAAEIDKAIVLDGTLAEPYRARAMINVWLGHWSVAAKATAEAEQRGGDGSVFYRAMDYFQKSVDIRRRSAALDPLSAGTWNSLAYSCEYIADADCQLEAARRAYHLAPENVSIQRGLVRALTADGKKEEAWALLGRLKWMEQPSLQSRVLAYMAGHGDAPPTAEFLEAVSKGAAYIDTSVAALADMGRWDDAAALLDRWGPDSASLTFTLFRTQWARLRTKPQFWALMKREGLTDYWKQSGKWPDFCAVEPVCKHYQ
ncbi:MAG: TIR domain-containing protein [Proteobacteria bacterium]|nr:TIR domain-containing protein [Pseudomonadota bacterium]